VSPSTDVPPPPPDLSQSFGFFLQSLFIPFCAEPANSELEHELWKNPITAKKLINLKVLKLTPDSFQKKGSASFPRNLKRWRNNPKALIFLLINLREKLSLILKKAVINTVSD
jgi:hypothetical protein